jgi:cellulose biosynthesis protein BcsQ
MPMLLDRDRHTSSTGRPRLPQQADRAYFSVCLAHRKGGVGKTTSTWYVGRELERAGLRVLLRDLDPQQGLTDIVRDLGGQDGVFSSRLVLAPEGQPLPWVPDVELIDTPPSLDESLPGVNRADAIIVPVVPEHQAVRALERMLHVVERTRRDHPFLQALGILPVRVRPRWALHARFLASIEELAGELGYPVLPPVPESQDVLRYSLRGHHWKPVADRIVAAMARRAGARG